MIIWRGHAYGRRVSSVTGTRENKWGQLPPWVQGQAKNVAVHGELHVMGMTASAVKTALKSGRENGWNDDLSNRLRFTAFRVVYDTKKYHAFNHHCQLREWGFHTPMMLPRPYTRLIMSWDPGIVPIDYLDRKARDHKFEGWVIKEQTKEGEDISWWKYKCESTVDLFVTGWKEGDGKYLGLVGALICSAVRLNSDGSRETVEVASVSGMTDEERENITEMNDKGELIGQVVEVKFQCVASKGRLRHPRFLRFRDDKLAQECSMSQIDDLTQA
jgi:hypothetical protein